MAPVTALEGRGPCRERTVSRGGFSIPEILIASSLLLLALGLAFQLIAGSQAMMANSGQRQIDMSVELALNQLRADVRNSRNYLTPTGWAGSWISSEPLRLVRDSSGGSIAYQLVRGELSRITYAPGQLNPESQRLVLDNVESFRWRGLTGLSRSAVQIEIRHRETAPLSRRRAGGQLAAERWKVRTFDLTLLARRIGNSDRVRWW
ncbi:MAG: hypothetical protein AAF725_22075 [Acidobacteriota bacterium]